MARHIYSGGVAPDLVGTVVDLTNPQVEALVQAGVRFECTDQPVGATYHHPGHFTFKRQQKYRETDARRASAKAAKLAAATAASAPSKPTNPA